MIFVDHRRKRKLKKILDINAAEPGVSLSESAVLRAGKKVLQRPSKKHIWVV